MNNFAAGIHILVLKQDKYLFIKRNLDDEDDPGCWDLPGGGIDSGEQPLDAAIREAKEEAGINVLIGKILKTGTMPFHGGWSIEIYVEGIYKSGEVVLSEEHSDFIWVTKEEIRNLEPKSVHIDEILSLI